MVWSLAQSVDRRCVKITVYCIKVCEVVKILFVISVRTGVVVYKLY